MSELQKIRNAMIDGSFVNIKDFGAIGDGVTDDTVAIQNAIDYCYNNNNKTILFEDKKYNVCSNIIIQEGISLRGLQNTVINYTSNSGSVFIFKINTKLEKIQIDLTDEYDDSVLLFSNEYLMLKDRINQLSNVKVKVRDIVINSNFVEEKIKNIAIHLKSVGASDDYTAGFWDVDIENVNVRGCDTVIKVETLNDGWLNGCKFTNIIGDRYIHLVHINNSGNQIYQNIFDKVIGQCRARTKENVIDNTRGNNHFINCYNWDSHLVDNAKTGLVNHVNYGYLKSPTILNVSGYASQGFQKLGTFEFVSGSAVAKFLLIGTSYTTSISIYFSSGLTYAKIVNLDLDMDFTNIRFYTKTLTDNSVELYVKFVSVDLELKFIYLGSTLFFYEPHNYRYSTLEDSVEIPSNRYILKSMALQSRVYPLIGSPVQTVNRPTDKAVGFCCYDTTLQKPIWLKATPSTWIDSAGNLV